MDIHHSLPKILLRSGVMAGTFCLLLSGCFMESVTPISPVEQASYPADIIGTWTMLHNKNVIHLIEAKNKHQLKVTFKGRDTDRKNDQISYAHISHLNGANFINNISAYGKRYEFYKFDRPCADLILIYLPNPDQIDRDIKAGRLKGRIIQDFLTSRIIEETPTNLVKYLKKYQQELFIPFRYMVRQSQADKLSEECKSNIKPIPGDPENKYSLKRN